MRIDRVDLWHVGIPLPRPFYPSWIPGLPQTENRFTLVRLRTTGGLEGWSAGPALGRERAGLGALLGPYLLGERADDLPSIRQRLREMSYLGLRIGWLEAACLDLVGKSLGRPVHALLAKDADRRPVELYASSGQLRTTPREMEGWVREGFRTVKVRVHADTLAEDVAKIRAVREALGPSVGLGVDANQAWRVAVVADAPKWDYARALAFCRAAHESGYGWVEEPLAMDDYAGLARLRSEVDVDLTGGELNNQGLPEFQVMLEKGCYDVYQPDAVFTGGIAETWQIVRRVRAAGCRYTPHTWTNGFGFAINLQLHVAARTPDDQPLESPYDPPWVPEVRDGLLREPFLHRGGTLPVPTAPGLGFEVDLRALARHGHHFFTGTKLRVAAQAVWDRGIRAAREAGATRDARLAARHRGLPAEPWREALEG